MLWYPEKLEQENILKEISSKNSPFDQIINTTKKEILLLQEYRTRLIADVVTGKLDVRAAAAQLPEDLEALEAVADEDVLPEDEAEQDTLEPQEEEEA